MNQKSVYLSVSIAIGVSDTAPEIYTVPPPQPKNHKPGQLTIKQVEQYFEDGFLVVPKFFTQDELAPVIDAVNESVDIVAEKLYKGGKITDKAENAGFYERLIVLEKQFPGAAILFHKLGFLPFAFRNLWTNERLLNVVEQFIGPEIAGHPVWNLRTKPPTTEESTVPWHQDNAYLDPSCIATFQPTAWIPLIDANITNGCMQVVRGGHRLGKTATHTCCAGGTWFVDLAEDEMERTLEVDLKKDVVTCEVPMGGLLFINNCIPHRSLENYSDKARWSIDLRWQKPGLSNGYYGLQESVLMRTTKDPNYTIKWDGFAAFHRHEESEEDPFDTRMHGPWMNRWEITHHNRHTELFIMERDTKHNFNVT